MLHRISGEVPCTAAGTTGIAFERVLRAQSDRGSKAVLKGTDLEKGEEGLISWLPFRHYGVQEAFSMWWEYRLTKCGGGL